ncbi:serine hydrolase domain-containing protein [Flagellimonas flava]|uniref:serine hydrolase domain-containing protein n=1 Tax=Flagellimonas flava TaxID=570519 RepID=UPI003D65FAC5
MKKLTLICFCCFLGFSPFYGVAQIQESQIDLVFKEWNETNVPGGSVGIIKDGELVFSKGYGLADLEHDIPNTPSTVFYIGSNGKQFAAFCVLLLEEQGKLKLTDDIRQYLPDFPEYESPITIENLLYHTSGIRDYSSLWDLQGRSYFDLITAAETYEMLKRQSRINFPPGEEVLYSNGGYFLLSEIVQRVTGKSLKDFAKEHIFDPLGMEHTLFLDNHKDLIKNRAFGYYKNSDGDFDNAIRRFELVGSGGVYSTVLDLYKWDQNFYKNRLGEGGQKIINKMLKVGRLNNGESTGESAGIQVDDYKGITEISHGGSRGGFRTQIMRFPEQNFSVIVLSNRSDTNYNTKAREIADLYLEKHYSSESETRKARSFLDLKSNELAKFIGDYIDEYSGRVRSIEMSNDTLFYVRSENRKDKLVPFSQTDFEIVSRGNGQFGIAFEKVEQGRRAFSFVNDGRKTTMFKRFEPKVYAADELQPFVGSYYSKDLNVTYYIKIQNEELTLFINHNKMSTLKPIAKGTFVSSNADFGVFFFADDKKHLKVNASRIKDVEFERI